MTRPTIATWLYAEMPGAESTYPNVVGVGASSSLQFQAVYWRCVAVFFATSVRCNPDARHVLLSNVPRAPTVDGLDLGAFLEDLGVEAVVVPFTYAPPAGYFGSWGNQFYVFDLIRWLSENVERDEVAFLLDSDCLWVRPVGAFERAVREHGLLTYEVPIPPEEVQNGLSRRQAGAIYADLGAPAEDPPYIGGEVFAATGADAQRVVAELNPLWDALLERHREGKDKFNEEAQALSFIYHKLRYPTDTAAPFIRRIWTTLFDTATALPADLDLTVWHLPSEKRYGIRRLFPEVMDRRSTFWSVPIGAPFVAYLGRKMGVPRRSPQKLARDLAVAIPRKIRQTLGRS